MTTKAKEDTKTTAAENDNQLYPFIIDMQSAAEIDQLWGVFLQQFRHNHPGEIKQAEFAYRAGIFSEMLLLRGRKPSITRRPLTRESLPDIRRDFDCQFTKEKFLMFKRIDSFSLYMVLKFKKTTPPQVKENELLELAHVFFNQAYLLLKIKNFEFHSIKDDITLAYNQNYLKAFMQNEIERSKRFSGAFSVIFFDLDNLKAINEQHGHLIGTEVLKEVAAVLRSQVRKMDLLSRFGGDEFVIVLLHADVQRAYEVCTRIKAALRQTVFLKDRGLEIKITGCFGISSFPENGNTADELIQKADIAMYQIKHMGKDGIKIYEGDK